MVLDISEIHNLYNVRQKFNHGQQSATKLTAHARVWH